MSDSEHSDQPENSDFSDSSDGCDCGLNSCEECFNRYFGIGSESKSESATPCPECTEEQVCQNCLESARCAADGRDSAPHIWISEDNSSNDEEVSGTHIWVSEDNSSGDEEVSGPHVWVSEDSSNGEDSPVSMPCLPHVVHHHFHWAMNAPDQTTPDQGSALPPQADGMPH